MALLCTLAKLLRLKINLNNANVALPIKSSGYVIKTGRDQPRGDTIQPWAKGRENMAPWRHGVARASVSACAVALLVFIHFGFDPSTVRAQDIKVVKNDYRIDALDPGIKLFVREKMAAGNTRFTDENIVVFLHGATSPATCDFDLQYKDYSWADWMVKHGFVVYMVDYRNYGGSSREKAMDEPPANNKPVTRS